MNRKRKWKRVVRIVLLPCLLALALAAIAVPRFLAMLEKAHEASWKGALGEMKSAASIYYGDHEGVWPGHLNDLVPDYFDAIPADPNGNTKMVRRYDGTGGWVYDSTMGNVYLNIDVADD